MADIEELSRRCYEIEQQAVREGHVQNGDEWWVAGLDFAGNSPARRANTLRVPTKVLITGGGMGWRSYAQAYSHTGSLLKQKIKLFSLRIFRREEDAREYFDAKLAYFRAIAERDAALMFSKLRRLEEESRRPGH